MEMTYWIGRQSAAMAMARGAAGAEARLIHYEMAGRYGLKAASCWPTLPSGKPPEAARAGPAAMHILGARGAPAEPGQ